MIALALVAQLLMPPAPDSPIVGQLFAPEWVQPGHGSRTPFVNVRGWPYFAACDGNTATDDGPAFQAAHDGMGPDGGTIVIPAASAFCSIRTTVAFTKPIRIVGMGWNSSELVSTVASLTWFTTLNQVQVENMGFTASGGCVNTCIFIKQLSTSTNHNGTLLRNVFMQGAFKAYWAQRATEFHVEHSKIVGGSYGLYLENLTTSDEGDSYVESNTFSNGVSGIFVASTSGLYASDNKFNGAAACHIDIAPTGNVGDFTFTGGSIEGHTTCGIRVAGSFTTTKVLITGIQFSSSNATHIILGNNAQNVSVEGDTFNDTSSAQGLGIDLQAGARNVRISDNSFHSILTAMQATTTVLGVDASGNRFASDVTNYWSGEDSINGQSAFGSSKTFAASRQVSNSSDVTYVDVFKVKGDCTVDVEVSGTVQGVANSYKFRKVLVTNGSTITDAIAVITVGTAFDLQVAAAGGFAVVSIKRATATGTSVTMMVTVRVVGYPTSFLHV